MIYVIRLIKRLSAQNVRAYTGRANLRPSDARSRRWMKVEVEVAECWRWGREKEVGREGGREEGRGRDGLEAHGSS